MMALSFFIVDTSLFVVGFGLNTILILRYISSKRYEKKGFIPPFDLRIFLKYTFSYLILLSTAFMIFHPAFSICLIISIFLNTLLVIIYAIVTLLTKRTIPPEETKPSALPEEKPEKSDTL